MAFLTLKTVLYGANVAETDLPAGGQWVESVRKKAAAEGSEVVVISGKVESELIDLAEDEQREFLKERRVLFPAESVLLRLVGEQKKRAREHIVAKLAGVLSLHPA